MALRGIGIGAGRVVGPVFRMPRPQPIAPSSHTGSTPAQQLARAVSALAEVAAELRRRAEGSEEVARQVLDAIALMAEDPALHAGLRERTDAGEPAEQALEAVIGGFAEQLRAFGGRTAERAADLADLGQRAMAVLGGAAVALIELPTMAVVLVADDLAPADAALLDARRVLAVVIAQGGPTSHTAIMLRAAGIPAVVAVGDLTGLESGARVSVDAEHGTVETVADDADRGALDMIDGDSAVGGTALSGTAVSGTAATVTAQAAQHARPRATTPHPAPPGEPITVQLLANLGAIGDAPLAVAAGAEGAGLVRTELLATEAGALLGFEAQRERYTRLIEGLEGRPLTFRVFDAGADKPLLGLGGQTGTEPNPALGVRGIRALHRHPQVLETQLEALAAAQAATGVPLRVMAPMVADRDEAVAFVELARGFGFTGVGVMVEVPSAVFVADQLAAVCDFLSIGTNDLAQYAFAADRQHPELGRYQDPWHPALLRMVREVAAAGSAAGIPVGVCGEAAADPALAVVLAGLGVASLSMSPIAIEGVRAELARVSLDDARRRADAASAAGSAAEARAAR